MQAIYLNPLTDFGFKKLFGEEPHKDLLISFLNTLLPEKHQIATLQYRRDTHQYARQHLHATIIDIDCLSTTGEEIIIQLQKAKPENFLGEAEGEQIGMSKVVTAMAAKSLNIGTIADMTGLSTTTVQTLLTPS